MIRNLTVRRSRLIASLLLGIGVGLLVAAVGGASGSRAAAPAGQRSVKDGGTLTIGTSSFDFIEKFAVEREYGMPTAYYGRTMEIDHIVSLELGGSNTIANLYPEPGAGAANYHIKDRLENRLHALVCSGAIMLRAAQSGIARDWEALYRRVFGVVP